MAFSKLHESCKKCKHKDDCDNKRMVACGVMTLDPTSQMVNPHMPTSINLGDIQIGTSLEEDINKQLEKKSYKEINCNFTFDELRGLK
ncbi:hypothetical protein AAK964_10240 [Tissierella praeacuta]|uniref:hypothetical protein n=1 Tax=Tissierella praeacuta TaxID=43131 RepID=UPI003512FB26